MHVAIIMDGNGRWATERGLPRTAGHIEGAKAVRATVERAARAEVKVLTLYAFSSANWARPEAETAALMRLFGQYLFTETRRCVDQSIRINVIGRRDRLILALSSSPRQCPYCGGNLRFEELNLPSRTNAKQKTKTRNNNQPAGQLSLRM